MEIFTKFLARFFVFFVLSVSLAKDGLAESLPEYRPALLGHYSRSLVNLIDTQSLMQRGQKDAIVMFECGITTQGYGVNSRTYRESPNSELLKKELMGRMDQAQFEPAVYRHSYVPVYVHGTVNFFIRDGKPHLRIFLNQSEDDLKSGRDFIEPQFAFVPGNTAFKGIYYPPQAPGHSGVACLKLEVDTTGKVRSASVVYEYPPGMNFGPQAVGPIRDALFIPGFRNGKPVDCQFTWTIIYTGAGRQMRIG
ncbi:MAG: energy transducer TonB [Verrucomicrobiota bacterium]|nr:energy transducer TonB [Verrucomicrobiota bacterium]